MTPDEWLKKFDEVRRSMHILRETMPINEERHSQYVSIPNDFRELHSKMGLMRVEFQSLHKK